MVFPPQSVAGSLGLWLILCISSMMQLATTSQEFYTASVFLGQIEGVPFSRGSMFQVLSPLDIQTHSIISQIVLPSLSDTGAQVGCE